MGVQAQIQDSNVMAACDCRCPYVFQRQRFSDGAEITISDQLARSVGIN
jgi:hypothetical protein